jgi:hypothetical protein
MLVQQRYKRWSLLACSYQEIAHAGTANNVDVNTYSDDVLSKFNIDGLKTCEGRSSLKLKVLLVHPNGNIVTRNPTNEKTVQIIRNLVFGGWNAVFDHPDEDFEQQLRLAVKLEDSQQRIPIIQ